MQGKACSKQVQMHGSAAGAPLVLKSRYTDAFTLTVLRRLGGLERRGSPQPPTGACLAALAQLGEWRMVLIILLLRKDERALVQATLQQPDCMRWQFPAPNAAGMAQGFVVQRCGHNVKWNGMEPSSHQPLSR